MEDQLRKVLDQLQTQYGEAARQMNGVRQTLAIRERDKKVNALTLREIEALPRGTDGVTCYKGVGRMFMQESRNSVENTLKAKEKEIAEEASVLMKKVKYLENEMNTAEGSLRDLLQEQKR